MFVLIWVTLLLAVNGRTAEESGKDEEVSNNPGCDINEPYSILSETNITAEAGGCVVLPCVNMTETGFDVKSVTWHKCHQNVKKLIFNSSDNENIQSEYKGRASLLESDQEKTNCSIIISNLTKSDSGLYYLRVTVDKADDCNIMFKTTVTVTDLIQKPTMTTPPLTEGQQTTLTSTASVLCSGSHFTIIRTQRGAGRNDSHMTGNNTCFKTESLTAVNQTTNSSLTFTSSAEHNGTNVTCKVSFTDGTVNSTTSESGKGQRQTSVSSDVVCTQTLKTEQEDLFTNVLNTVKEVHGIIVAVIGFVMGVFISAIIACVVMKCIRKKQKRSRFPDENVELIIAQSAPLMDDGSAAVHDGIHVQHAAEGGAESSEPLAPDGDMGPIEVEYSDIDFSVIKRRNPTEVEEARDTKETEYAEIKKEATEERPGNGGEDGEVLEGSEEKVVMIGEDEEAKLGMPAEEEGGEDAAQYSSVIEVMDEI